MARELRKVRWARVAEIDRRTKVGTPAWHARHTTKQKHLSVWRFLHARRTHATIRKKARALGVSPTSNMTLRQKLTIAKKLK